MSGMDHAHWAKMVLQALVSRVKNFQGGNKYISYGALAKAIGYPGPYTGNCFAGSIGKTLCVMGDWLDEIHIDGARTPRIQALVVSRHKGLPGRGFQAFESEYSSWSVDKKKAFINREYQRIFNFGSRWEAVLARLDIESGTDEDPVAAPDHSNRYNSWGSEGSPEHRALRDYIAAHPEVAGLVSTKPGVTEYPLKSGDSVDVLLESDDEIVAVEVKSIRSGNDDIERGLFQCVKYQAVLSAEGRISRQPKPVRCILVLQENGNLPAALAKIRKALDITVQQVSLPEKKGGR